MRFPLLSRFAIVAGVALALLIPVSMIRDKVHERQSLAADVQRRFAEETSGPQTLAGPVLALTCEETYIEERTVHQKNGKPLTVQEEKQRACPTGLFFPAELSVQANAPVEEQHRGIYPIRLYRAQMQVSGAFQRPGPPGEGGDTVRAWKDAFLVLGIGDARGIRQVRSQRHQFAPGTMDLRMRSGLHASLGRYADLREEALVFGIELDLVGTSRLQVAPIGRNNDIRVASPWPHPSFIGAYTPDQRGISAQGFSARWRVSHLATGGAAFWTDAFSSEKLFSTAQLVGVALVEPVNPYMMSYRATEYGFLFILLTFALFGLVELAWGVRMHAMQYLLTGLALSVFFLLLIALSEHVYFGLAYLAASSACVALLGFYLRHPLGSGLRAALFTILFAGLYAALYVLLKSEDHALLLGSLLVFGVLAATMALTRRLDWTGLSRRLAPAPS